MLAGSSLASIVWYTNPGGHDEKTPPSWDPAGQAPFSFRDWAREVVIWSVASPLDERREAAAVARQLMGAAKRLIRTIPPAVRVGGGVVGGRQAGPMT